MRPFRKLAKNGHYAKAIAFAKWSVWVKIKIAKSMRKTAVEAHYCCIIAKNGSTKQLIFEK